MGIYDKYQCLSFFIEVIACVISDNLYKPLIILLSFTRNKPLLLDIKITSCYTKHSSKSPLQQHVIQRERFYIVSGFPVLNLGVT